MCFYYLFNYKKMNALERNPKKYIQNLFGFLTLQGFNFTYWNRNGEELYSYEKNDFHISIECDCNMKMNYVYFYIYYRTKDCNVKPIVQALYVEDEKYKELFNKYEELNCMEKLNLVAEYLTKNLDYVIKSNTRRFA